MKIPVFISVLLLFVGVGFAQPPDTLWTRILTNAGDNIPTSICELSDGGYLVAGSRRAEGRQDRDFLLVRTSPLGVVEGLVTWGDSADESLRDCREIQHSEIIVTGETVYSFNHSELHVARFDSSLNEIWTRSYHYQDNMRGNAVASTSSETIIVVGSGLNSGDGYDWGRSLMILNMDGDTLRTSFVTGREGGIWFWRSEYISLFSGRNREAILLGSGLHGECSLHGWSYYSTTEMLKLSEAGDTLSHIVNASLQGGLFKQEDNSSILVAEKTNPLSSYTSIMRLDSEGSCAWTRSVWYCVADLAGAPNQGYLLLHNDLGISLTVYDSAGHEVFNRVIAGDNLAPIAVNRTSDGGYIITAVTGLENARNIMLVKTTPVLNLSADNIKVIDPVSYSLTAFPNPFNPRTSVAFTLPQTGRARLAVYDIMGREVRVLHEGMTEAGEHSFTFDGTGFASGIYFARLASAGVVKTQKLLLLK